MKSSRILCFLLLIFTSTALSAKDVGLEISYAQFMDADDNPYLEIYFALAGESIDFKESGNNSFLGGVEIIVSIKDSSQIFAADKFKLQSPELKDTSAVNSVYIHQLRFSLEDGTYSLVIDITDFNEPEEKYHLEQNVTIKSADREISTSDLLFLDSYSPSEKGNIFSKSGYDLVPMVNSGSYYFNENIQKISFYVELYNTSTAMGAGQPYVVKYYIRDAGKDEILNNYASFSKKITSEVQPILASFDINNLRTGNYELTIEALDKEGKLVIEKSNFFYRQNNTGPLLTGNPEDADITGTFVDRLGGMDSLYLFTKYLYPISSESQQNYQKSLLKEGDLNKIKRYFYTFWVQQNDYDPEAAWEDYHRKVNEVNRLYETRLRRGYMSDRGRVALLYGKPDLIESRKMEPNLPPYEIWQYGQVNTPYVAAQTNKIFVFAEFQPSTNDYQLLHSTAIGELQSRDWRYDLRLKGSGNNRSTLDGNGDPIFQDDWGSRTNSNVIMGGSGSDRQNR